MAKNRVGLYHRMYIEENFELCANRLFEILLAAQNKWPDRPRYLYFGVDGHRNEVGGFDADSLEIMTSFLLEFLGPYFSEITTPLICCSNPNEQRNDVPKTLTIRSSEDYQYDFLALPSRPREKHSEGRKSPPSAQAIADYLGMSSPRCLVCGQIPAERAHALPNSLGGSYDVRNFALLCVRHHKEAPDIADAEAFWTWIDFACLRESQLRRAGSSSEAEHLFGSGRAQEQADFMSAVRIELVSLYGWNSESFEILTWDFISEVQQVLDKAAGSHFGVTRKVSTYAWAYETARKRIGNRIA